MKSPVRSSSEKTQQYFIPPSFPQVNKAKTFKGLSSTSTIFDRKASKGSTLVSFNNGTSPLPQEDPSSSQNDYFPNLIKPKQPKVHPSGLKINTVSSKKLVSFRESPEYEQSGMQILTAKMSIGDEVHSSLTEDGHNIYLNDRSKSIQSSENLIESNHVKLALKKHGNSFGRKNKENLLNSLSESKKGLKEKLNEYHIIKQYRKQSFLHITTNSFFPSKDEPPKPVVHRKKTNPSDDLIDPSIFLHLKKYRLAKFIVTNLKLKEELFLFEEKKITKNNIKDEVYVKEFYSNNPIFAIYEIPDLINQAMMSYKQTDKFFPVMLRITEKAFETKDRELYVKICKLHGKITSFFGEYLRSLVIYKQCLQDCEKYDLLRIKMSVYKRIGNIYLKIQNIDKSKNNFLKMLHLALILNNKNYEILAYDCLGIIYYYKCDIKKAVYFHTRMLRGTLEGEHSLLRDVAFTKLNTKKNLSKNKNLQINLENMNCSSSTEHDSNFFDIKSEDVEYTDIKDYKRKFNERRKKTELSKMIKRTKGRVTEEINYNTQLYKLNHIPTTKFVGKGEVTMPSKDPKERLYKFIKSKKERNQNKEGFFEKLKKKENPIKKSFYLVHLSSNRSLNPFQFRNRNNENYNVSQTNPSMKVFLNKTDEFKIVNSLNFLKKNIFLAINTIKKMSNHGNQLKIDDRIDNSRRKAFLMP